MTDPQPLKRPKRQAWIHVKRCRNENVQASARWIRALVFLWPCARAPTVSKDLQFCATAAQRPSPKTAISRAKVDSHHLSGPKSSLSLVRRQKSGRCFHCLSVSPFGTFNR